MSIRFLNGNTSTGGERVSEPAPLPEPCADTNHCWHPAQFQHAMMHHVDETCCHCGQNRCRSTMPEHDAYRAQHGRYCP